MLLETLTTVFKKFASISDGDFLDREDAYLTGDRSTISVSNKCSNGMLMFKYEKSRSYTVSSFMNIDRFVIMIYIDNFAMNINSLRMKRIHPVISSFVRVLLRSKHVLKYYFLTSGNKNEIENIDFAIDLVNFTQPYDLFIESKESVIRLKLFTDPNKVDLAYLKTVREIVKCSRNLSILEN